MKERKTPCISRVWCAIQIFIQIMDLVTDCSTLVVYYGLQSKTIFTLALISVILSLPIGVAGHVYQFQICRGREKTKDTILTLKLLGILVESIPQLTINLYVLSGCEQTVSTIQWVSAAFSFLGMCVGIAQYDISVKLHKGIGFLHKLFILLYRASSLASRMLVVVYFSYVLAWWIAAVVLAHWGIGLISLMKNKVETLARSLAFVFLNTFVYVGEFAGIKALFILLLYVLENLMMVATALIVSNQVATQENVVVVTTLPTATRQDSATGIIGFNDFQPLSDDIMNTTSSLKDPSSLSVNEFCLHSNVLMVHVALNVVAIVACCLYNVSFHYNSCMDRNSIPESAKPKQEDNLEQNDREEELKDQVGLVEDPGNEGA